jgi:hypothetical protein
MDQASSLDEDLVVRIASPRAGEAVSGTVVITGFAMDRLQPDHPGLNERDIQVWLADSTNSENLLGYAAPSSDVPNAPGSLNPDAAVLGFARVWDTCTTAPGQYEIIIWVSSLARPGARSRTSVDVEVGACPADTASQPSEAAGADPVVSPPAAPPAPSVASAPGRVLLRDDFSDPNSGWPQSPSSTQGYRGGEYGVGGSAYGGFAIHAARFSDFLAEVDAHLMPGSDGAAVYVDFRIQDSGPYYSFGVVPDQGTFYLTSHAMRGGSFQFLISPTPSAVINRGTATNRLGVRAEGPNFTLLVNGQEVGRARDDAWREGRLAIGVVKLTPEPVAARFGNLVVTSVN